MVYFQHELNSELGETIQSFLFTTKEAIDLQTADGPVAARGLLRRLGFETGMEHPGQSVNNGGTSSAWREVQSVLGTFPDQTDISPQEFVRAFDSGARIAAIRSDYADVLSTIEGATA